MMVTFLTVTIDFNGSTLVEKSISYRKGPPKFRKWLRQIVSVIGIGIGIGIGQYKPSELRD